ncbi:hypothetical protein EJ06DRAFT_263969 [Trichodelitschia bisporula]|uniref:Uncharacterized protein n=1 Tax=Trichodelitschia bisporula TaxID=703511 RepID=A0A6G1HIW6_9PEZI|nr:hypothetical protein EJ06DRAFT_263969 [Trichodelitschia bisporula]
MRFNVFTALLASATVITAMNINPVTVTSITPEQALAIQNAEASYVATLTKDPAFTSLVLALATDSSAINRFTSVAYQLQSQRPTGSGIIAAANSAIDMLPSPAASFLHSVLGENIAIASRVLNDEGANPNPQGKFWLERLRAKLTRAVSPTTKLVSTTVGGSSTVVALVTATANAGGEGARMARAAGVAMGVLGAAAAVL